MNVVCPKCNALFSIKNVCGVCNEPLALVETFAATNPITEEAVDCFRSFNSILAGELRAARELFEELHKKWYHRVFHTYPHERAWDRVIWLERMAIHVHDVLKSRGVDP